MRYEQIVSTELNRWIHWVGIPLTSFAIMSAGHHSAWLQGFGLDLGLLLLLPLIPIWLMMHLSVGAFTAVVYTLLYWLSGFCYEAFKTEPEVIFHLPHFELSVISTVILFWLTFIGNAFSGTSELGFRSIWMVPFEPFCANIQLLARVGIADDVQEACEWEARRRKQE